MSGDRYRRQLLRCRCRRLIDMRNQLDDLQRQLGTGKKSDSYAGLGLDRGLTVGPALASLRDLRLSAAPSPRSACGSISMQTALTQFDSVVAADQDHDPAIAVRAARRQPDPGSEQRSKPRSISCCRHAQHRGRRPLSVLRPRRRSGRRSRPPITSSTATALKAGLKQIIDERRQADLGASGLGRLVGRSADRDRGRRSTEDAVSPFGFKLVGVDHDDRPARPSARRPARRRSMSVDLGAANPNAGDTVKFTFTLPDGTSRDLTLTATSFGDAGRRRSSPSARTRRPPRPICRPPSPRRSASSAEHRAGGGLRGRRRQRFLQHRRRQSAAAGRRPAVRHRDRAGRRHRRQHRGLVHRRRRHRRSALDRACARRPVADRVLRRARQRARACAWRCRASRCSRRCSSPAPIPTREAQYAALQAADRRRARRRAQPADGRRHRRANSPARRSRSTTPRTATTRPTRRCRICCRDVEGAPTEQVAAQILALQTSLQATLQTTAMLLQTNPAEVSLDVVAAARHRRKQKAPRHAAGLLFGSTAGGSGACRAGPPRARG